MQTSGIAPAKHQVADLLHDKNQSKNSFTNQRGAVMMLLVLLLLPILIAIAMVIDTSRLTTSDSELERIANSMSLGALEDYLRTSGTAAERTAAARTRAVAIANLNSNSLLVAEDNTFNQTDFDDPNKATLDFGTWFFEEPAQGCNNPSPPLASPCPCTKWRVYRTVFSRRCNRSFSG